MVNLHATWWLLQLDDGWWHGVICGAGANSTEHADARARVLLSRHRVKRTEHKTNKTSIEHLVEMR